MDTWRLKEPDGKPSAIRVLCQSKNNYAEFDPPALLFELCDGFRWVGVDPELTAEDLYNRDKKQRGRPAEKKDVVKSRITRLLGSGKPVLSSELESAVCELTGCHPNTVTKVKKELGVDTYQSGRQWFSVLPGQNAKNSQDTINP